MIINGKYHVPLASSQDGHVGDRVTDRLGNRYTIVGYNEQKDFLVIAPHLRSKKEFHQEVWYPFIFFVRCTN